MLFNSEIYIEERETKTILKLRLISHPKHLSPPQAPNLYLTQFILSLSPVLSWPGALEYVSDSK